MKLIKTKRIISALLASMMMFSFVACTKDADEGSAGQGEVPADKPDTWIADRHIVLRTFDEDIGLQLPDDQINNPVAQEIKRLTGMTMEIEYTAGVGSLESLTTALLSGDLPDVIYHYLNDSTRPEYPVILKAAREGILIDIAPHLRETEIYGKYYEEGYLPSDTYDNIHQREEFDGGTYSVHMRMNREETVVEPELRGGLYIQQSIVDKLGIKPWEITTIEQLNDLLVQIKDGGFTDTAGNPIIPLGPSYWGGTYEEHMFSEYYVDDSNWEYTDDGVSFISQNNALNNIVKDGRKLLEDGLMHKEIFTMDTARAQEGALSYSYGIIANVHSGMAALHDKADYVPLGATVDKYGRYYDYKTGKTGYSSWSIPTGTENPEEIVKFADFLASYEGKLLWQYGIEGVHYDMVDGNPHVKQDVLDKTAEDTAFITNENVWAGGNGSAWGAVFGRTDMDTYVDFGELTWGLNTDPAVYEQQDTFNKYGLDERPYEKIIYETGFSPEHYANVWVEEDGGDKSLPPLLKDDFHKDIIVQAIYASSQEAADDIINEYAAQLEKSGLNEFREYLNNIIETNPESVKIRSSKQ